MKYDRKLNGSFKKLLSSGGSLEWIKDVNGHMFKGKIPLDVQIRKNKVSIYCGLTKICEITEIPDGINLTAANAYVKQGKTLLIKYCLPDIPQLYINWGNYVNNVEVNPRYTESEGRVQSVFSFCYGKNHSANDPLCCIDRECLIGYKSEEQRDKLLNPILEKYRNIGEDITKNAKDMFGHKIASAPAVLRSKANEVDALAITSDGNLAVVEIKNKCGYLSPIQVAIYKEIWDLWYTANWEELRDSLNSLVMQKICMQLLPPSVPFLKEDYSVIPVILFGNVQTASSKQMKYFGEIKDHIKAESKGTLDRLEVYNISTEGNDMMAWKSSLRQL